MAKRKISLLILAVCFLLVVSMLFGCNDKDFFDEETQREIITAFVNLHSNDFYPVSEDEVSLRCYGAFDGVYVLFVDVASWGYTTSIQEEIVANVKFIYSCGQTMTVYSDGTFYTITEAYENGVLSYDNMLSAQQAYKACNEFLYKEGKQLN